MVSSITDRGRGVRKMAKMKAGHSTSVRKKSASRRVKSLGKQGSVPISKIRAAVRKLSAAR
jgi:hypothetical protein